MEERNVKISLDKAREWYKQGGELKEIALSAFTEKEITESALPNTWQEFCDMYPLKSTEWFIDNDSVLKAVFVPEVSICNRRYSKDYRNVLPSLKAAEAHRALMQLHQLRDCYRQGWLPDWENSYQRKWIIFLVQNEWKIAPNVFSNRFLSFKSEEIARKFFNNFKYLIETAGDLI